MIPARTDGRSLTNPSRSRMEPGVLVKMAAVAGYYVVWWSVYDTVNGYVTDPVRTVRLASPASVLPCVIQPWTAVIYVTGGLIFPAVPFLYHLRSWRGVATAMARVTVTSLLSFTIYWLWPLSIVRPQFAGETLGERLMLWVFSIDKPGNCFPSSHVFFSVLGVLQVHNSSAGRAARWFWSWFAVAVCVTTVTSGQHYFIDVPGGVAVALTGYTIGGRLVAPAYPSATQAT